MSEKNRIIEAIRMRMRRNGMTYAQLAKKIGVSEVSVKRYFSEERLTLDTLDDICKALGAPLDVLLAELKSIADAQKDTFTGEQESALAEDEFLFVLFFLVARGYTFKAIESKLSRMQTAKIIKGLRELETLGLISYPTDSGLRTLVSRNAHIVPGGPLWKKYSAAGIKEFFNSKFAAPDEYFKLSIGYLSEENALLLKKKYELLEHETKTMLAIGQVSSDPRSGRKFYWIADCFRPMESSILELIADRSKLL